MLLLIYLIHDFGPGLWVLKVHQKMFCFLSISKILPTLNLNQRIFSSGSVKGQTLYLTKITILYILTTLTPNDYLNAIWYNNRRDFVLSNCAEGFLPATTRNKRLLRDFLDKIEERDQASLPPALNMSFAQFAGVGFE